MGFIIGVTIVQAITKHKHELIIQFDIFSEDLKQNNIDTGTGNQLYDNKTRYKVAEQ